ncbi:MAG: ABC transporter permease [Bacillota bacterium]
MKVLTVAYYEILKYIRDIKLLLGLTLFPVLLILILGNTVDGFLLPRDAKKIPTGYINEDEGIIGSEFENLINSKEVKKLLELKKISSMDEGQKILDEGKIEVLIHIEKNVSYNMASGKEQVIHLYGSKNVEFVESIIKNFTSSFNTVNALLEVKGRPTQINKNENIERVSYQSKGTMPKAIDYYSVLTMLQILLAGAIFGVFIKSKKYESDLNIRLYSLPVPKQIITTGRILGSVIYVFVSSIITVLFSKYVFDANWDGNVLIISGTLLLFSAIAVGMGLVIGSFTSDMSTAMGIIFLIMFFFSAVSGSISPASTIASLSFISPNYYAKTILFGTIYGYPSNVVINSALILAIFCLVIYSLAGLLGRRENYDNI